MQSCNNTWFAVLGLRKGARVREREKERESEGGREREREREIRFYPHTQAFSISFLLYLNLSTTIVIFYNIYHSVPYIID